MPFEPEHQRHVTAAQGYVELGLPLDADAELELVDADVRHLPEILAVRIQIYFALKKWDALQVVAKRMALYDPDDPQWTVSWAYATRRADSIDAARLILINAVERLPNVAIFHYNLACYECQLGDLDAAKSRLKQAFELESGYRAMALDDEDLRALWNSLAADRRQSCFDGPSIRPTRYGVLSRATGAFSVRVRQRTGWCRTIWGAAA